MIELVVCGRGGQGTMTTAQLLAQALVLEGKFVQAFPSFYPEKRGALYSAFVRFSSEEILLRCEIYHPDYLIALDPNVLFSNGWGYKVKDSTRIVANARDAESLSSRFRKDQLTTIDATQIAIDHKLGTRLNPSISAMILGTFAAACREVRLQSLDESIEIIGMPQKADHLAALKEAFERTRAGVLV